MIDLNKILANVPSFEIDIEQNNGHLSYLEICGAKFSLVHERIYYRTVVGANGEKIVNFFDKTDILSEVQCAYRLLLHYPCIKVYAPYSSGEESPLLDLMEKCALAPDLQVASDLIANYAEQHPFDLPTGGKNE